MEQISKQDLIANFKDLGIEEGDVVLVRADLGSIGRVEGSLKNKIIDILLEVVGKEGTIVGLAFTKNFFLHKIDKNYIYDQNTTPTTGAFAKLMLNHPLSIRSNHPSNSFIAIGKKAKEITEGHNANSTSFEPMKKLLNLKAKMILIGCVKTSPGFTTVHLAQESLGYSKQNIFKNRIGVYYQCNNDIKLFRKKDFGGCSYGFSKFYANYIENEILTIGKIGNAYSISAKMSETYPIEMNILKEDPTYALCNKKDCLMCRGSWFYNKKDMPEFYIKHLFKKIFSKVF